MNESFIQALLASGAILQDGDWTIRNEPDGTLTVCNPMGQVIANSAYQIPKNGSL